MVIMFSDFQIVDFKIDEENEVHTHTHIFNGIHGKYS